METQAITVRLPAVIYEALRAEAFQRRVSQASIVVAELADRYELAAGEKAAS